MNHGIEFLATDLHTDHLKIPLLDFCRQSSACRTLLCCHSNSTSCILGTQRTFSTLRWDVVPILLLQTIYIIVEQHEQVHYSYWKWERNQVMAWAEHSGQNPESIHFYWSFFKKKKFYEIIQELREINPEDKKAYEDPPPSLPEQGESWSCSKRVPKRARGQEAHPEKETWGSRDMFTFCLLTHSHRTLTLFPEASPASKPPMLAHPKETSNAPNNWTSVHNKNMQTEKDQQDVFCSLSERVCLVLVELKNRKQTKTNPQQHSFPEEQHSRMTIHWQLNLTKIEETTLPACVHNQPLLRGRHQNRSDSERQRGHGLTTRIQPEHVNTESTNQSN